MRRPKNEQREIDRSQGALLGSMRPSQFLRHVVPPLGYAVKGMGYTKYLMESRFWNRKDKSVHMGQIKL